MTRRTTRPRYAMPAFIRTALAQNALTDVYEARPRYQQNDYIGWITRAKRPETRNNRLSQMLSELRGGELYMGMRWRKSRGV
jgi:uncharacterized protein YdeI (YjbR/CyaY-like superfamily)